MTRWTIQAIISIFLLITLLAMPPALIAQPEAVPVSLEQESNIQKLVGFLQRGTEAEREGAAARLAELHDPKAIDPLIALTQDANPLVRKAAVNVLANYNEVKATDALLPLLKDKDVAVRARTAQVLGWRKDPRLYDALLPLLQDPAPEVRSSAARSLANQNDQRAINPLLLLLKDAVPDVRAAAAYALRNFTDPRIPDVLAALLTDPEPWVRLAAVNGLVSMKDARALEAAVALLKEEIVVRADAIRALGELGDTRAVEPLIGLLDDDNQDIRALTADTLGYFKDERAGDPLIKLIDDPDEQVSQCARSALCMIGAPAVDKLAAALHQTEKPALRLAAALVLQRFYNTPAAASALIAEMQAPDPQLRLQVLDSLSSTWDVRMVAPLTALLKDPDAKIRAKALQTLSSVTFADPRTLPTFQACLTDPNAEVRKAAVYALEIYREPQIPELVLPLLQDDRPVRVAAVTTLGITGDLAMQEPLIQLLTDKDAGVRKSAINSFGSHIEGPPLGDERVVEPLLTTLRNDPDDENRLWAVYTLSHQGEARAFEAILAALQDRSDRVKVAAIESIPRFHDRRAIPPLLELLRKGYTPQITAGALGQLLDEQSAGIFTPLLDSENSEVRMSAASQLAQFGDEKVFDMLNALLKKDNAREQSWRIYDMLSRMKGPRVNAVLLEQLHANPNDASYYLSFLEKAIEKADDPRLIPPLLELLKDRRKYSHISEEAARVVGKMKCKEATELLITLLSHPEESARNAACKALGQISDTRACTPLRAIFENPEESFTLRLCAAESLFQLGDAGTVEPLIAMLNAPDCQTRRQVIRTLGHCNDPRAMDALLPILREEDTLCKWSVILALRNVKDLRAVQALAASLNDPNCRLRQTARTSLEGLKESGADPGNTDQVVDTLCAQLQQRCTAERQEIITTLGKLGNPRAVQPLLATLADPHSLIRQTAAAALGALADPRACPKLRAALADRSSRVQDAAAEALGALKDRDAIEPLITLLATYPNRIKSPATQALKAITGQDYGDDAGKWQKWWEGQK